MKKILILWLITLLAACSADIDDYQAATPNFDLFGYFEGESHTLGNDSGLHRQADTPLHG